MAKSTEEKEQTADPHSDKEVMCELSGGEFKIPGIDVLKATCLT